ncbi:barstar family protein [Streptomyces sp. NPDC050560]|uniref:barstar family protein n=1 Tax=Streptomyces sp. NPDC050560 TaxID=3365630 RepID=UPI0037BCB1AC
MITIDVSEVSDEHFLHLLLMRELDFPEFYGRNWDAFWDAITGLVSIPNRVRFLSWDQLAAGVPRGAAMLRRALDDYQAMYRPEFVTEYAERSVAAGHC